MDQKKLRRSAFHEACHLAVAAHCGFRIYWARCWPVGESCIGLPYEPAHLAMHYQEDPWKARRTLQWIVAVTEAPAILLDIPAHADEIRGDQEILRTWQQAWEDIRAMAGEQSWRFVHAGARLAVRSWYRAPRGQAQVEAIATVLQEHRVIQGKDLQMLLEDRQPSRPTTAVQLKPEHALCSRNAWRDFGGGLLPVLVC